MVSFLLWRGLLEAFWLVSFWLHCVARSRPRIGAVLLQWKRGVLTTGPPASFLTLRVVHPNLWQFVNYSSGFLTLYWLPTPVLLPGNPMDGGAWWATVHGVAKSWTWLSDFTHFHWLLGWFPFMSLCLGRRDVLRLSVLSLQLGAAVCPVSYPVLWIPEQLLIFQSVQLFTCC